MKKYRCKKGFSVECCDGDGFCIPNKYKNVEVGEVYELDKTGSTIIGGDVHLDGVDGSWLEISNESLQELFEEIVI